MTGVGPASAAIAGARSLLSLLSEVQGRHPAAFMLHLLAHIATARCIVLMDNACTQLNSVAGLGVELIYTCMHEQTA